MAPDHTLLRTDPRLAPHGPFLPLSSVPCSSLCSFSSFLRVPSSFLPGPPSPPIPCLSLCLPVRQLVLSHQQHRTGLLLLPLCPGAEGVACPLHQPSAGAGASLLRARSKAGAAQRNTKLWARLPGEAKQDLGRLQQWPWSLGPCPEGQDASLRLSRTHPEAGTPDPANPTSATHPSPTHTNILFGLFTGLPGQCC